MAANRVYLVFENGEPRALVSAVSRAAAVRHHLRDTFEAKVASQNDLCELIGGGMKVQQARDEKLDDALEMDATTEARR